MKRGAPVRIGSPLVRASERLSSVLAAARSSGLASVSRRQGYGIPSKRHAGHYQCHVVCTHLQYEGVYRLRLKRCTE